MINFVDGFTIHVPTGLRMPWKIPSSRVDACFPTLLRGGHPWTAA